MQRPEETGNPFDASLPAAGALDRTPPSRPTRSATGRCTRIARVGLVITVFLIALLAVVLPYRPVLIPGPHVERATLSFEQPLPGLRLHVFNTGTNKMSSLLVGASAPWRAVPAFVIEHPSHGLIVFDLGLSHAVAEYGEKVIPPPVGWLMKSRGRPGLTLEAQMKNAGLQPHDVSYVVISHLHQDHTGVAAELERAVFLAGPDTRSRAIEGPHSLFRAGHVPAWREIDFEHEGHPIGPFDSGIDLFGDGSILLIAGAGHTPEDVMMWVNLVGGPVLLTGDAVVHHDWLESNDVERIASDPLRAAQLRNRIRSLRDSGETLIIPGHDLRHLGPERPDLIRHHPERFEPSSWPIAE